MILRLSLDLPEDMTYIRTTRLLSRCLLQDIKVDREVIEDVEVIVTELCSNVIRHAQSKERHFQITLEYSQPQVVITVTDSGRGFSEAEMLPVGAERRDIDGTERHGGFGMMLLEGLSDKLDFTKTEPHGTTVRVEKMLHYETQADADRAMERDRDSGDLSVTQG